MSYLFDIGRRRRKVGRFIGQVRRELVRAFLEEQQARNLTREELARELGVHKSVVTRRLNGSANLTLRIVAELADALGRDLQFSLRKPAEPAQANWSTPDETETETIDGIVHITNVSGPHADAVIEPSAQPPLPTAA